jgi:dCMP deaminase
MLSREELSLALKGYPIRTISKINDRLGCGLRHAHEIYNISFPIKTKWITRFMSQAELVSSWSRDPSTKCGAVIVDSKNRVVSTGFNGFPQKFKDTEDDYKNRNRKYNLIVHSEINAIIFANKSLDDCVMFCYPMIPCCRCAAAICQTGIKLVVFPELSPRLKDRWSDSEQISKELFEKCGVMMLEIPNDENEEICKITGSEIDFDLEVELSSISEVAKDIWKFPNIYSEYKNGSEDAYYKFLKFLWIEFPNGEEVSLPNYVDSLEGSDDNS